MITLHTAQDTVILRRDEQPAAVGGWGGTLAGDEHVNSDGSKLLLITGDTPGTIALEGSVLWVADDGELPDDKMRRLGRMRTSLLPVTLTISPDGHDVPGQRGVSVVVRIKECLWELHGPFQASYHISLVQELTGGLATRGVGTPWQQTNASGAGGVTVGQARTLAAQVGPQTARAEAELEVLLSVGITPGTAAASSLIPLGAQGTPFVP